MRKTKLIVFLILPFSFILSARAGSATWNLNPTNNDWNTAANWTPNTVPNGPDDIATFEASNQTDVTISSSTQVNELIFSSGASGFTINVTEGQTFTISGTGITNNSAIDQNFVIEKTSHLNLTNSAMAGELTFFALLGGTTTFEGGGAFFFPIRAAPPMAHLLLTVLRTTLGTAPRSALATMQPPRTARLQRRLGVDPMWLVA